MCARISNMRFCHHKNEIVFYNLEGLVLESFLSITLHLNVPSVVFHTTDSFQIVRQIRSLV